MPEEAPNAPLLTINPIKAQVDEVIHIYLSRCPPKTEVTLRAKTIDEEGKLFESHAVFVTSEEGSLEVGSQKPIRGTYDEADPMGLFWSMELSHKKKRDAFVKHASTPVFVDLTLEIDGNVVTETVVTRCFSDPYIKKQKLDEDGLVGCLYRPSLIRQCPGVLILGGTDGGNQEHAAALLATHGYAALALSYFGVEGLPKNLVDIPIEYFEKAIQWMKSQHEIIDSQIAVIGFSRGGELALLLGTMFDDFKAVIAGSPSAFLTSGMVNRIFTPKPAWTYRGESLPYLPFAYRLSNMVNTWNKIISREPFSFLPIWDNSLKDKEKIKPSRIPVEKIKGPVLLISGGDDQLWPSSSYCDIMMKRLTKKKRPFRDVHVNYEKAGHFLCFPYSLPNLPVNVYAVVGVRKVTFGGSTKENAHAARASWMEILKFLDTTFKKRVEKNVVPIC